MLRCYLEVFARHMDMCHDGMQQFDKDAAAAVRKTVTFMTNNNEPHGPQTWCDLEVGSSMMLVHKHSTKVMIPHPVKRSTSFLLLPLYKLFLRSVSSVALVLPRVIK